MVPVPFALMPSELSVGLTSDELFSDGQMVVMVMLMLPWGGGGLARGCDIQKPHCLKV